jgi:formylglycine-generating enzyme required for sulfatase activity
MVGAACVFAGLAERAETVGHYDREPGYAYPTAAGPYTPRPFKPRQYVAYRTVGEIAVDGRLNESSWRNAEWTEKFGHIVFEGYRTPLYATRAKVIWDDRCIYFAGELEEPNLTAHLALKDTIICLENDFEIFIDADNDSRNYIEIEFNALGTVWDMIYEKELDKGSFPKGYECIFPGSEPWDVKGMRIAVRTEGTLNYPFDRDEGWTFECAIPWESLQETVLTGERLARDGSVLGVSFSRVEDWFKKEWPMTDWRPVEGVDWLWTPMLTYRAHVTEAFGHVILSGRTVLQPKDRALEGMFPFLDPPLPPKNSKLGSMVRIRGGTFAVGPDDEDPTGASPRGSVTVKDFFMDCYEVTIGEYAKFLNAGGHDAFWWQDMADPDWCGIVKRSDGRYEVAPGKELYPVTLVKLDGAKAYAAWVGKRLPTEYEWEIAARGGGERLYPWGNEPPDPSRANYDYHVGHAVSVGSYPKGRTPEGLYDMAGNVNEMIDAVWSEYPWGTQIEGNVIVCPVARGGAWTAPPFKLKATHRDTVKSHYMAPFVGFRCAKDAD